MTNLDPQTTDDFWDAYLRAASAGTKLAQLSRTFPMPRTNAALRLAGRCHTCRGLPLRQ